uniref:FAD dependent oxidoreductase domain-containing protein n=1 Tax=Craspedostauros australis TaxID=1486917 RepID=A0A7R9ZPZ2_9STRA
MKEIGLDADSANNNDAIATAVHDTPSRMVKLPGTQLRLSATSTPEAEHTNGDSPQQDSHPTPRNIVVVGGGIMGASVAMQLARLTATAEAGTNSIGNVRKTTITVVDLAPTTQDHATVGRPTRAWLHASGKTTKHYQRMNQWGLQSWKEDPALRKLPSWTGSLARFATPNDDQTDADGSSAGPLPAFLTDGGYAVEGPLTKERLRELKPIADWNMSGQQEVSATDETDVYYFADEGTVDPDAAARTCRDEAESLGVVFLKNCDATGLVWSDRIEGVQCGPYDRVLPADVVVVAGDAAGALGDLPQDGLPVVGYLSNADGSGNSGVYSLVNHSGVTLGPLLGSMAAVEILRNVQLDVLKKYRPSRFGK